MEGLGEVLTGVGEKYEQPGVPDEAGAAVDSAKVKGLESELGFVVV